MKIEFPSYEIVKATSKIGLTNSLDRKWVFIDIVTGDKNFIKHLCPCATKVKVTDKIKGKSLEVILKPYCYTRKKNRTIYYIGQCKRCETVYWTVAADE